MTDKPEALNEKTAALTAILSLNHTWSTKTQQNLSGKHPNDEDLTAFLDGTLSSEDHNRVKAYIARDNHVYQRWVELATQHKLTMKAILLEEKTHSLAGVPTRLLQRLKQWLSRSWVKPVLGTAVAASVFTIMISPHKPQLDDIYRDYPLNVSKTGLSNFSSKALPFVEKSKLTQAVEYGIYVRLNNATEKSAAKILIEQSNLSRERPEASGEISEQQIKLAQQAGELAILQMHYCSDPSKEKANEFFTISDKYTKTLIRKLKKEHLIDQLRIRLDEPNQKVRLSCWFSMSVLKII